MFPIPVSRARVVAVPALGADAWGVTYALEDPTGIFTTLTIASTERPPRLMDVHADALFMAVATAIRDERHGWAAEITPGDTTTPFVVTVTATVLDPADGSPSTQRVTAMGPAPMPEDLVERPTVLLGDTLALLDLSEVSYNYADAPADLDPTS